MNGGDTGQKPRAQSGRSGLSRTKGRGQRCPLPEKCQQMGR